MRRVLAAGLALTLLLPLVPRQADAFAWLIRFFIGTEVRGAALGGVARGIVGNGFRQLAAGGGRALIRAEASAGLRAAAARRVVVHRGQERMLNLFGRRTFRIGGAAGEATGSAVVEGDLLVFRAGTTRIGFAQWESEGLVLYRANGVRVARLVDEAERVVAYDAEGNYLGQFIKEQVEDALKDVFIDALGNRHTEFVVPDPRPGQAIPEAERDYSYAPDGSTLGYSAITDGTLRVFAPDGGELARGVMEHGVLVIYDQMGERRGSFRPEGADILALDADDQVIGAIRQQGGRAVYFEQGKEVARAAVELVGPSSTRP